MTLAKILSKSVRQPNGCILFRPGKNPGSRYGSVSIPGYRTNAHKAVWILTNGPVPEGMCVMHSCDRPRCVNIKHLSLGTMAQNMADRDAKGHNFKSLGESCPLHKLTAEEVLEIRKHTETGIAPRIIAETYSVSLPTVNRIAKGTTWRHILSAPPCPA